jgi:hypothetical protein
MHCVAPVPVHVAHVELLHNVKIKTYSLIPHTLRGSLESMEICTIADKSEWLKEASILIVA